MSGDLFLPGLPADLIEAVYRAAPGNEIDSGKFASPESSAALAANSFGAFLTRPGALPPLPGLDADGWPATGVQLEAILRFPWAGGRHPCLDVLVTTPTSLVGVESKRFEPFRPKQPASLSEAYWRPVWGPRMGGYEAMRDGLRDGTYAFVHLDAAQLVKHAFALRTAVRPSGPYAGKRAILFYLYAEPEAWPDGTRRISDGRRQAHQAEIARFADVVGGDEVAFHACSYGRLLDAWSHQPDEDFRAHAAAIVARFSPCPPITPRRPLRQSAP